MTVAPKRLLSEHALSCRLSISGHTTPALAAHPAPSPPEFDLTIIITAMAGPAAYALAELLKEPFGPYWEDAALTKAAPSTTPKNPLPLRCVLLESGGLYTGYVLGQTEAGFVILCALCAS